MNHYFAANLIQPFENIAFTRTMQRRFIIRLRNSLFITEEILSEFSYSGHNQNPLYDFLDT